MEAQEEAAERLRWSLGSGMSRPDMSGCCDGAGRLIRSLKRLTAPLPWEGNGVGFHACLSSGTLPTQGFLEREGR